MTMLSKRVALYFVALLVLAGLTACGEQPASTDTGAATSGDAQTVTIVARDNVFDPTSYEVKAGQPIKLTVKNEGQNVHVVEVKDLLPETTLNPGQSKTVDLPAQQAGTHKVYCETHEDQGMEGSFVIK